MGGLSRYRSASHSASASCETLSVLRLLSNTVSTHVLCCVDPGDSGEQPPEDSCGEGRGGAPRHQRQQATVRGGPLQHQHRREPAQWLQCAASHGH